MRHSSFTAVYDTCVLYPAPLRDFLIRLGLSGRFRARWSAQIHDEWKRNLLLNRPDLTMEQLNRTSTLMDRATPDALVTGHEDLIAGLTLLDPNDRDVLTALSRHCQQREMCILDQGHLGGLTILGGINTSREQLPCLPAFIPCRSHLASGYTPTRSACSCRRSSN